MRIDINTNGPVKDPDVKAIYLLKKALEISTPRMVDVNLKFAIESFKSKNNEKTANRNKRTIRS